MGDSEFVTKLDCSKAHRELDNQINDAICGLRLEYRTELEKVYSKIDRLFWAGIALVITSLVSICLTLFSLWAGRL